MQVLDFKLLIYFPLGLIVSKTIWNVWNVFPVLPLFLLEQPEVIASGDLKDRYCIVGLPVFIVCHKYYPINILPPAVSNHFFEHIVKIMGV